LHRHERTPTASAKTQEPEHRTSTETPDTQSRRLLRTNVNRHHSPTTSRSNKRPGTTTTARTSERIQTWTNERPHQALCKQQVSARNANRKSNHSERTTHKRKRTAEANKGTERTNGTQEQKQRSNGSNEAAKQRSNEATKQRSNKATKQRRDENEQRLRCRRRSASFVIVRRSSSFVVVRRHSSSFVVVRRSFDSLYVPTNAALFD